MLQTLRYLCLGLGLPLLLLTSCVTPSELNVRLNTWVGVDADQLVSIWGAPYGTYEKKDGSKVLSYNRASVVSVGPIDYERAVTRRCQVNFNVDKGGKIISVTWSGDMDECDRYAFPSPSSAVSPPPG